MKEYISLAIPAMKIGKILALPHGFLKNFLPAVDIIEILSS